MRTLGFAIIVVLVAAYAVTSFLHGSPWYWIRAGSLAVLIAIVAGSMVVSASPRRRHKTDAEKR